MQTFTRMMSFYCDFSFGRCVLGNHCLTTTLVRFKKGLHDFDRTRVNFYYITEAIVDVTAVAIVSPPTWSSIYSTSDLLRQQLQVEQDTEQQLSPQQQEVDLQQQQIVPVNQSPTPPTTRAKRKRKKTEVTTSSYNSSIQIQKLSTFETKVLEVKLVWKAMYGTTFPSDVLYLKDTSKVVLPPAPHQQSMNVSRNKQTFMDQYNTYNKDTHKVYDTTTHAVYNKSTHIVISKR